MSQKFPPSDATEIEKRQTGPKEKYLATIVVRVCSKNAHNHRKQEEEQDGKPKPGEQCGKHTND
jgi:hypothetical protein